MINRDHCDLKIDAYLKAKEIATAACIDVVYEQVKALKEAIATGQELPFEHPEQVLEGMQIVLSELQGLMR
jgi:hypothetical protein